MTDKNEKSTLLLEVITPEKLFLREAVHLVNIPGMQGELGILKGHMALVVELIPGLVTVYNQEMEVYQKFVISGGFAEINAKSVTILTEEADYLKDFDYENVSSALAGYRDDLEFCDNDVEKRLLHKKLVYHQVILNHLPR